MNVDLQVATLEENVTVTGVSPIVDVRSTTQGTRFNTEELQAIPSTRDVFQVLTQRPFDLIGAQRDARLQFDMLEESVALINRTLECLVIEPRDPLPPVRVHSVN